MNIWIVSRVSLSAYIHKHVKHLWDHQPQPIHLEKPRVQVAIFLGNG